MFHPTRLQFSRLAISLLLCIPSSTAQSTTTTITNTNSNTNINSISGTVSSSTAPPVPSSLLSLSSIDITTSVPAQLSSGTRILTGRSTTVPTTIHTSQTITLSPSPTPSTTTATSTTVSIPSSTPTPTAPPVIHLDTHIDPAFGVLGVLLILTGLPSAFLGHKNRWSSFFLTGFYGLSLMTAVLILKFGVEGAENPPTKKLRGLFLLASIVAGAVGGGIAIFWWKAAKYFIGAWGGFAFGLWVQAWHSGGIIRPIGFRWFLYIGCAAVGFILSTIPRIHYHVLLISTAIVGASAFMLGVDCFSTAGLKEFYIYNLGFSGLFPKFKSMHSGFPLTQTMQIELGIIAAVALCGAAVQFRILALLQVRLQEIALEHRKREQELEAGAAARFEAVRKDREDWEKAHGGSTPGGSISMVGVPLMSYGAAGAPSPGFVGGNGSSDGEIATRPASSMMGGGPPSPNGDYFSSNPNISTHPATPTSLVAPEAAHQRRESAVSHGPAQSPGILPSLDLGGGVKDQLPNTMISKEVLIDEHPDIKKKAGLLSEIRDIRRSIDALNVAPRRMSLGNLDTLTSDAEKGLATTTTDRQSRGPRPTVKSMIDVLPSFSNGREASSSTPPHATRRPSKHLAPEESRPKSIPTALADDWNTYVAERKLFMPPSGITAPIIPDALPAPPRSPSPPLSLSESRPVMSEAVAAALGNRHRRESLFGISEADNAVTQPRSRRISDFDLGGYSSSGSGGAPVRRPSHTRHTSMGDNSRSRSPAPVTILPPRRDNQPSSPPAPRVVTYEELTERHKAKMHAMQNPITRAATEEAQIADAKNRWERSKAVESKVMAQREAEKARRLQEQQGSPSAKPTRPAHRTSLSVERLTNADRAMHRTSSTSKVEEWQKHQQEQAVLGEGSGEDDKSRRRRSQREMGPSSPTSPRR